jgi:hypothetical protein
MYFSGRRLWRQRPHVRPFSSLAYYSNPFNTFSFDRWAVAALTLVIQIRSKVELKAVPWLFFVRVCSSRLCNWSQNISNRGTDDHSAVHRLDRLYDIDPSGTSVSHTARLAHVDYHRSSATYQMGFQRPDTVTRSRRTLYCSLESRPMYALPVVFVSVG